MTNDRNTSTDTTDQSGRFRLVLPHTGADEFVNITVRRGDSILLKQALLAPQPHLELKLLLPNGNASFTPK